jgi:hypothetical protein
VFGDLMEEIDEIQLRKDVLLEDTNLFVLIEKVRKHETIYKQSGAVHGCALATTAGEILMFVEDVGRHNAVDAIAGFMWLDAIDGSDKVFYTTGRLTSEMVIKCAQMRIPFLVSRSGLTHMGHQIAKKVNMTDARPRQRPALPRVYRQGTTGQVVAAADGACMTWRRDGKNTEATSIPEASSASTRNTLLNPPGSCAAPRSSAPRSPPRQSDTT